MSTQFNSITHLASGTARQQHAYEVLERNKVLETLHHFDPVLVGTVPINVDIHSSDLDIICYYADVEDFQNQLCTEFSKYDHFQLRHAVINDQKTIIANLMIEGWPVEIFGQPTPSRQQVAYRHMIAEYRLLLRYGEQLRQQIVQLKNEGYKTEPAFAKALGIKGDPYQALLILKEADFIE